MTDLSPIQPAFSGATANKTVAPANTATAISSDFETFLKMLTVQMQNQDPLNPVDSADYAVQLATFSAVEQQVLTNDLLGTLVSQSGAALENLAGWVGMEVRVPGTARFDGNPIAVWAEPSPGSDRAFLVARDGYGNEITRNAIIGDGGRVEWSGDLVSGGTALHGTYAFEVESQAVDGTVIDSSPAEVYTTVIEVQSTARGLQLVTSDGAQVAANTVTALRQP